MNTTSTTGQPTVITLMALADSARESIRQYAIGYDLVVLAYELVRDVEDFSPVLADDEIPGDLVAAQTSLDERFDGDR